MTTFRLTERLDSPKWQTCGSGSFARSGVDPIAGCGQERCRPDSGVWLGARCFIPLGQLCFQAGGIRTRLILRGVLLLQLSSLQLSLSLTLRRPLCLCHRAAIVSSLPSADSLLLLLRRLISFNCRPHAPKLSRRGLQTRATLDVFNL